MGFALKLIDSLLFVYFLMMATVTPLFDASISLPQKYCPKALVDLDAWYGKEYGDYLAIEKPHFFVGLIRVYFFVLAPLSIINIIGLISSKPWFSSTCLIHGASLTTSMAAILSEVVNSGKASDQMKMAYYPFLGMGLLTILRGLLPISRKNISSTKHVNGAVKKRA